LSSIELTRYSPDERPNPTTLKHHPLRISLGPNDLIVKVTALRMGASTHSYNSQAAFLELNYEQTGRQLNIQLPKSTWEIILGFWVIFAWNNQGVPSPAEIIRVAVA
jgi:hypothetical protein